jgi:hypothetical protein
MWLPTTPCVRGRTPVTRLTWVGQVVLGNTACMLADTTPRAASCRKIGIRSAGSSQ